MQPAPIPHSLDQAGFLLRTDIHNAILFDRPTHTVYRLSASNQSWILKVFKDSSPAKEVQVYSLLQSLGIPTLPVVASNDNFLLLEDIESGTTLRLAQAEDLANPEVGVALASWYRKLHQAGSRCLLAIEKLPDFLISWIDEFDGKALSNAGQKLGLDQIGAWQTAIRNLEVLKDLYRSFPQTFNYSDFAAENLALSSEPDRRLEAIVFDYDCFSIGTAYSDCRNVLYSLQGSARSAFISAYDAIDWDEEPVDRVLSTLEAVFVASRRERLPDWAKPILQSISKDEFANTLASLPLL